MFAVTGYIRRGGREMRVFVTGATGFVGSRLVLRLLHAGHEVVAFVRSERSARARLPAGVELVLAAVDREALRRSLASVDAVVHLAGRPVLTRFTARAKRELHDSRVGVTDRLVEAIRGLEAAERPKALVSASAIGYYGDCGDAVLDETSPMGKGYLADLCRAWEASAEAARELGLRVVCVRVGLVLGAEGGILSKMLGAFRLGLGAVLGSGRQYMPWVHEDDLLRLLVACVEDPAMQGVYNGVAPHPVRAAEFARELGDVLGRPVFLRVPTFALQAALGEAGLGAVASQNLRPARALAQGFRFTFPTLRPALADLVQPGSAQVRSAARLVASENAWTKRTSLAASYVEAHGEGRYVLEQETLIPAPIEEVFAFFSCAENLAPMTPPAMAFQIETPLPIAMHEGALIDYHIAVGPLRRPWRTQIVQWSPPQAFADVQLLGPYACWFHEHVFERRGAQTLMRDRVAYALPLGPLGSVAQWAYVGPMLQRIFAYRAKAIAHRFGRVEAPGGGPNGAPLPLEEAVGEG